MTVRITVNRICDRCFRPFGGSQHELGEDPPEFGLKNYTLHTCDVDPKTGEVTDEKVLFNYRDMCDTCDGVFTKALAKLRMTRVEQDRAAMNLPPKSEESSQETKAPETETPVEPEPTPESTPKESSPKKTKAKSTRAQAAAVIARKAEKKVAEDRDKGSFSPVEFMAEQDSVNPHVEAPAPTTEADEEEELPF